MFTLNVPSNKLELVDVKLNKANVVYRVSESNGIATLKFKRQSDLDEATEALKDI